MTAARLPMPRAMWAIARFHGWMFPTLVTLYVVQYCMNIAPALILRSIIDSLSANQAVGADFWSLIAVWIGAVIANIVLFIMNVSIEVHYMHRFWSLLRANLFERILQRPGANPLPGSAGEAVNVLRDDVNQVQQVMSMTYNLVATAVFAAIALAITFSIHAEIALLVFVPLTIVTALVNQLRARIKRYREAKREADAQVSGALGEIFNGAAVLKSAGAEERVVNHLHQLNRKRRDAGLKDSLLSEGLYTFVMNLTEFGTPLILFAAGSAIRDGSFTVGDLTLFTYFMMWIGGFTNIAGRFIATVRQGGVSFDRMQGMMQGAPPRQLVQHRPVYVRSPAPLPALPAATDADRLETLDVSGLTLVYPNGRGVQDISFSARRGEIVAITGAVGSGKTTLVRALLGLLPPDSGTVRWNGQVIDAPETFLIPPRAAYTPQIPRLFSDSLRDNLLMGIGDDTALDEALYAAAFEDDLKEMPDGLLTIVGARGMRLSGGQIQRMAAARMFARKPELIVVDDLSSALDVDTEQALWDRFFARRDQTCIVVTHRPHVLARAHHVIRLEDGRQV